MAVAGLPSLISSDLRPTYVAQPNERFATSFISLQNRDFAVKGEVLMDKATGEIFAKRTRDGRVVSFFQNKKYINDLMLNLKVMLNNNPTFTFDENNETGAYVNIDYDLISTQLENVSNIDIASKENINITDSYASFKLSGACNGFFVRLTSRDCDKVPIEWLTGKYNNTNLASATYTSKNYNAEVTYDIDCYSDSGAVLLSLYDQVARVRINSESLISLPEGAATTNCSYYAINIKKLNFSKLKTALNTYADNQAFKNIRYTDDHFYLYYMNVGYFVDQLEQIELHGAELTVALLETQATIDYLDRAAKLSNNAAMIRSIERPGKTTWTNNNIWAERIREVSNNGQTVTINESEVDIDGLEKMLAANVTLTTTPLLRSFEAAGLQENQYTYLATNADGPYSRSETDELLGTFRRNMQNTIDNIVSTNAVDVAPQGLYVEPVSIEEE